MTSSLPLSALDRFGGRVTVRVVPGGPVTPTSLPRGPVQLPYADRFPVALVDAAARRVGRHLPPPWLVVPEDDAAVQIAVSGDSDPDHVRRLRAQHPGLPVLAVVPVDADPGLVVSLLQAGADGCLRGDEASQLDAHLQVLRRRALQVA